ncbi:hypothetical protein DN745_10645 [Bradymonas sediminis]|uniref:Uncharacterized protein n=1 Tax=Bradymonas sediminis TaxID=1548548 RepID=A0A2Z4FLR4_9DELT|nr:hypothetical protein DN745_10645 [Bradymonas sediminis]
MLFIGSSHTFVHDVPGMVQRLGESNGTPIWVEALTIGGASLSDHLRGPSIGRRPYKPSARHCQFGCKSPAYLQL